MAGDWVKLYRSLMESDIWHDEWLVKLFVWCLLKASFRDSAFKGKTIERGQFVTGRLRASEELDVSPGKWLRGIEKLVKAGCISTKSDNQFTVITVCNYESYQDGLSQGGTANGTASSTANGTASGTPNGTANGTASSTRIKKIQEGEEVNTHTHTPARTREEQASPAPLKTWDAPAGADPIVIAAVDDWQAYRLSVDGRHDSGVRIDALIAEATRKGWAAAKIAASVQFSIAKGAKSWIDSDLDFEQQRKQTQTAKSDRKPTWAERHAMASEGDPF
jgi:hypothetical protein